MNELNPPPTNLPTKNDTDIAKLAFSIAACSLFGFGICLYLILSENKNAPSIWVCVGLFLIAALFGTLAFWLWRQNEKAKVPWPLSIYVPTFEPALKSGKTVKIEIMFQWPSGWHTQYICDHMTFSLSAHLSRTFAGLEALPDYETLEKLIRPVIAAKADELGLPICRFEVKTIQGAVRPGGIYVSS